LQLSAFTASVLPERPAGSSRNRKNPCSNFSSFIQIKIENMNHTTEKTFTLHITETNNMAGRYHYQVKDEQGNIISERRSNRVYAACTINGGNFFGRADLVDAFLNRCRKNGCDMTKIQIAYLTK
jgi:hypothetical protein